MAISELKMGVGCERRGFGVYNFGLDYIRLNFPVDFEAVLFNSFFLGCATNSNENYQQSFLGVDFDVVYFEDKSKKVLMFRYQGDSVFELKKYLEAGIAKKLSYVISFYSAGFYVERIVEFMCDFMARYSSIASVARLDICLDVGISVNDLYGGYKTQFKKKHKIQTGERIETFYLGSKTNNNKHFIRVYDKKLDSEKKGKFHLFLSYFSLPVVSRIELQMNVNSCKSFKVKVVDLVDFLKQGKFNGVRSGCVWNIFYTLLANENGTFFDFMRELEKGVEVNLDKKKTGDSATLEELPYAKIMLGYARRLHGYGFDVISFLQSHLVPAPDVDIQTGAVKAVRALTAPV